MPDIHGASGGSGLIGGQARVHGCVTCAAPQGLLYCSFVAIFKF